MKAWLVCPECKQSTDYLREGVCLACHYGLNGGDRAPDELLLGRWDARLAEGNNTW